MNFPAVAGGGGLSAYERKVLGYSPTAYWPLKEASGGVSYDISGNGLHGAYSGVTLGQPGIGDGRSCPYFNGSDGYVDVFSSGLNTLFDGDEFTLLIWGNMYASAGWGDGIDTKLFQLRVDTDNQIYIRDAFFNEMHWLAKAGGFIREVTEDPSAYGTDWYCFVLTRSKLADEMKAYKNGAQIGSTQNSLVAWAGSLNAGLCVIGATNTTPTNSWHGYLQHAAVFGSALAQPAITDLAVVV